MKGWHFILNYWYPYTQFSTIDILILIPQLLRGCIAKSTNYLRIRALTFWLQKYLWYLNWSINLWYLPFPMQLVLIVPAYLSFLDGIKSAETPLLWSVRGSLLVLKLAVFVSEYKRRVPQATNTALFLKRKYHHRLGSTRNWSYHALLCQKLPRCWIEVPEIPQDCKYDTN